MQVLQITRCSNYMIKSFKNINTIRNRLLFNPIIISTRLLQSSGPKTLRSQEDFKTLGSETPEVFNSFTKNGSASKNDADTGVRKNNWSSYSLPSKKSLKELAKQDTKEAKSNAKPSTSTKKRKLRPKKAFITLSPNALAHLKGLLEGPEPKLIKIGVRNRGCSGLTYDLTYIDSPGKFDEVVEQDGVKVVVDSKALFSIVGSEMDWVDDKLSSRFVFKNPNSKGTCGCGESFHVS